MTLRSLARKLKTLLKPEKRPVAEGAAPLDERERGTLYALFEAVTAHPGFPLARFESFLESRSDLLAEYRAAVEVLDRRSGARFKALGFATLTSDARETVLRGLFRRYPYRSSHAPILDRLGLTADNLDLLIASREAKALRQFVVRAFLGYYYDEPEGWLVVGYDKARGHALEEQGDGVVSDVFERKGTLWLQLSDGTVEEYDGTTPVDDAGEMIRVKGGRQRARITPELRERLRHRERPVGENAKALAV